MVWPVWTKDGPPCIAHMNPTKTYSTPSFAAQLSLAHSSEIRSPLELITGKKKKKKGENLCSSARCRPCSRAPEASCQQRAHPLKKLI